ncbi:hypothetical protein MY4824_004080 [Beauveria thailandica]
MVSHDYPRQEPDKASPKQEAGQYLIRLRRKDKNFDHIHATHALIRALSVKKNLDPQNIIHVGTSSTEDRVHIVVDYDNPCHMAVRVHAFKSRKLKQIKFPPGLDNHLHERFTNWASHRSRGMTFPIIDEIFPAVSTDPRAPHNLIRTTGTSVIRLE